MEGGFVKVFVFLIALAALAGGAFMAGTFSADVEMEEDMLNEGLVACTADAMQCPDGSYVGRTGPNCEFAPCAEVEESDFFPGKGEERFITADVKMDTCPTYDPNSNEKCSTGVIGIFYLTKNGDLIAQTSSDRTGRIFFQHRLMQGEYKISSTRPGVSPASMADRFPYCDHFFDVIDGVNQYQFDIWCKG
jgi:hypothetical protein